MRQYLIITISYWAFTLTDGALRMLVVLYFHQLGYAPLALAMLFVFYEFFGVVTNLFGGWLAARLGLAVTQIAGLALQCIALAMLLVNEQHLSVAYVMVAQALSGIAKDLNKMSAKSGVKLLVDEDQQSQLYRWVSLLTGSKNLLKGIGFFVGGALLTALHFQGAILALLMLVLLVTGLSIMLLDWRVGKTPFKPKFNHVFSKSPAINWLSASRFFLFGSRDVWFVIALPVFLYAVWGWGNSSVGALMALWTVGYGAVQMLAPSVTGMSRSNGGSADRRQPPGASAVLRWGLVLSVLPIALILVLTIPQVQNSDIQILFVVGLLLFGFFFAMNSAIHSYLIVAYADRQSVSLDVGFYYMSNAAGRLTGNDTVWLAVSDVGDHGLSCRSIADDLVGEFGCNAIAAIASR